MEDSELTNALECVLFAAEEPLPAKRIADVLQIDEERVQLLVDALDARTEGTGLHVLQLAGGYTLATRREYASHVQNLLEPDPQRLSRQALEVLAIVAYRQPITRTEIDALRGVNSSGTIGSLLEKDLLRITGRSNAPGRPYLLVTTNYFLQTFGLADLAQLPELDLPLPSAGKSTQQLSTDASGSSDETGASEEETDAAAASIEHSVPENEETLTAED